MELSDADRFSGVERRFLAQCVADPHLQRTDLGALLDRCFDGAHIDDARDQPVAVGDRHEDGDRPVGSQFDARLGTAEELCLADDLAGCEKLLLFKCPHAPVEQLAGFFGTLAVALHAAHGGEETPAVAIDRADNRIARLLSVAGLHPVGADIHRQQRITVALQDAVPGELTLRVIGIELRVLTPHMKTEQRQVVHGDGLAFGRQAGGVLEMQVLEADRPCALVHQFGEIRLRASHALGDHDAAVIRRLDDDALDEIAQLDARLDLREHGRGAGRSPAGTPGVLADIELVVHSQPAGLDGVEHDLHGHDLGQRCRRDGRIGILGKQHRAGVGVDEKRLLRPGLEQLLRES